MVGCGDQAATVRTCISMCSGALPPGRVIHILLRKTRGSSLGIFEVFEDLKDAQAQFLPENRPSLKVTQKSFQDEWELCEDHLVP